MNENRTIKLVEIPIGGKGGFIWNRLHGEREDICEALLKDRTIDDRKRVAPGTFAESRRCFGSIDVRVVRQLFELWRRDR